MCSRVRILYPILCGILILCPLSAPISARVVADGPVPSCAYPAVPTNVDHYPPSSRAEAEALVPVPPLDPVGDVARVTSLPLTAVNVERAFDGVTIQAGQLSPVVGITYVFGTMPSTYPFIVPSTPAFVTVTEIVFQQAPGSAPTDPGTDIRSNCGTVTAYLALPARQLFVSVTSNGEQATVEAIRQAILVDADFSPVPPTYTPSPAVTVAPPHAIRYYIMLRSQLLRTGPNGASVTGALVRFKERVWPRGKPIHGWQYITATHHRHGWVLVANIQAIV